MLRKAPFNSVWTIVLLLAWGAHLDAQIVVQKKINVSIKGKITEAYTQSYALVIGASKYDAGWPALPGIPSDVQAVSEALRSHGFQVQTLIDPNSENMEVEIKRFIQRNAMDKAARVIIYYCGHGHSVTNFGNKIGYIVPVDAPNPEKDPNGFVGKAMPMQNMDTYARLMGAKHVLFMFDACFAGTIFESTRALPEAISEKSLQPVRQFITAGAAFEQVPDESIFRRQFIEGIDGAADADKDGFVTVTELGQYLQEQVKKYSKDTQHPQYGKIRDLNLDKGDFLFVVPPKAMTATTAGVSSSGTVRSGMTAESITDTAKDADPQVASVLIRSDVDALLTVDYEKKYPITGGKPLRINVLPGTHPVEIKALESGQTEEVTITAKRGMLELLNLTMLEKELLFLDTPTSAQDELKQETTIMPISREVMSGDTARFFKLVRMGTNYRLMAADTFRFRNGVKLFKAPLVCFAAVSKNMPVAQFLISENADINKPDELGNSALTISARLANLELVKLLLEHKVNVNQQDPRGFTALMYAAQLGDKDMLNALLAAGADFALKNKSGDNAILLAMSNAKFDLVKILLDKGADANSKTLFGENLVAMAFEAKQPDLLAQLFSKGAIPNQIDPAGRTILQKVTERGYNDVVKVLIASKAKWRTDDCNSQSPIAIAIRRGYTIILKQFLDNGFVNVTVDSAGNTLAMLATEAQQPAALEAVIAKYNNLTPRNKAGRSALDLAAINGNEAIADILLNAGADVNALDNEGCNAAMRAAAAGSDLVLTKLLAKTTNVNLPDKVGRTALHYAAEAGKAKCARILLAKGAEVNAKDPEQNSAAVLAGLSNNLEMVAVLAEYKADLKTKNAEGYTYLLNAASKGYFDLVKLLAERGMDVKGKTKSGLTALHLACRARSLDLVRFLLAAKLDPDAKDEESHTPLYFACLAKDLPIATALLEAGADLKAKTKTGEMPIHYAAGASADLQKLFLSKGAVANVKDGDGNTPIFMAAKAGITANVDALLGVGLTLDIANEEGNTPLHVAVIANQKEMVEHLITKKMNIQIANRVGNTALHVAAGAGNLELTKILLAAGLDPSEPNVLKYLPLHLAAQHGDTAVIAFLLTKENNPNPKGANNVTPLHLAAQKGNLLAVEALLHFGADPNAMTADGKLAANLTTRNDIIAALKKK
jgi:ankyrin repeat protein